MTVTEMVGFMAGSTGIEPATSGLTVQCANQAAPRARIETSLPYTTRSRRATPGCALKRAQPAGRLAQIGVADDAVAVEDIARLVSGYHHCDPHQMHRSITTLAAAGLPMQEFPQTTANTTRMGQVLFDPQRPQSPPLSRRGSSGPSPEHGRGGVTTGMEHRQGSGRERSPARPPVAARPSARDVAMVPPGRRGLPSPTRPPRRGTPGAATDRRGSVRSGALSRTIATSGRAGR